MLQDLGINVDVLVIVMTIFIFVLIVMVLVLAARVSKLTMIYKKYMTGASGKSLADRFEDNFGKMDEIRGDITELEAKFAQIEHDKQAGFSRFAINRYDAFSDIGGKLSFSLCMLDRKENGFVLTSMHNAEGCYTYLKEIKRGNSDSKLSSEERDVLDEALGEKVPPATGAKKKR